jgi:hypothetical protein
MNSSRRNPKCVRKITIELDEARTYINTSVHWVVNG